MSQIISASSPTQPEAPDNRLNLKTYPNDQIIKESKYLSPKHISFFIKKSFCKNSIKIILE